MKPIQPPKKLKVKYMTKFNIASFLFLLAVLLGGGLWYAKTRFVSTFPINISLNTAIANPESIVEAFLNAAKQRDKAKARTFLAPTANKIAFASTLDGTAMTPSLYTMPFTYQIINKKMDTSETKAYITVNISVDEKTLPITFILEKSPDSSWKIIDSESVLAGMGTPSVPFRSQEQTDLKRVLLILTGSADFYLTSPEGTHEGFDYKTDKVVDQIENASYAPNVLAGGFKQFAVTNMTGTWELQIVGTADGSYTLGTQIVNTGKADFLKKNIAKEAVDTYILRYPSDNTKTLEITYIK